MLNRTRLSEEVFNILRNEIVNGDISGGTELMDTEVAHRFTISRTPAREALLRLAERKLLVKDVTKHQGYVVVRPSVEDIAEVYSLRAILERLAVEILRMRPDRQAITDNLEQVLRQRRRGSAVAASRVNDTFHDRIVQESGHVELLVQHQMLHDRMAIFRRTSLSNAAHVAIADDEHRRMVHMIREGDPAVGAFALQHVCAAAVRLISALGETPPASSLYEWLATTAAPTSSAQKG